MYYDLIHSMNKQTKTGKTDEGREIIPICGLGASVECSLMRSHSTLAPRPQIGIISLPVFVYLANTYLSNPRNQ